MSNFMKTVHWFSTCFFNTARQWTSCSKCVIIWSVLEVWNVRKSVEINFLCCVSARWNISRAMHWQEWTNGVGCKITSFQSTLLCFWVCERLQADSVKIAIVAHLRQWVEVFLCFIPDMLLQGGADKSLARRGRKQATATKLGIHSTYSPWISIQFLARCSNFCKPHKNSEGCPSNQVSTAVTTSAADEKWRPFNCFFSPGNRW